LASLGVAGCALMAPGIAAAQNAVPSASQVKPPVIATTPPVGTRIALPEVPAGGEIPAAARKLAFILVDFDITSEFPELAAKRRELAAALTGRRITVAQVFDFASQLQAAYVAAGYPLARVVILPQELGTSARVRLRVVDGFIERMDSSAIGAQAASRVSAVLSPLMGKRHLTQGELERQLLIAGEVPGLILNATFAAGKEVGGSVLVLTGRYRPISAVAYVDNAMPKSFGSWQFVNSVSANGVLGLGEQVTLTSAGYPDHDLFTSRPTRRYLTADVLLPLGIDGWSLGVSATNGVTTPRVTSAVIASQGVYDQAHVRLAFEALKRRDYELVLSGTFDATNEELDSLFFMLPLNRDRTRVIRGGIDGIWRLRSSGTTLFYGGTVSQGLNALGARSAAEAALSFTPLSRDGADAAFTKAAGHVEIDQSLPYDFVAVMTASGQTAFNRPLLVSEQFDIVGARQLSGYDTGTLVGDNGWVVRAELQRPLAVPGGPLPLVVTPYLFGATGERNLVAPTVLEMRTLRASNLGGGLRFNVSETDAIPTSFYGFAEGARQYSDDPTQDGWRLFAGVSWRY
jgi:hemolysin activation/secretion protein